jgi:hypothetical protein
MATEPGQQLQCVAQSDPAVVDRQPEGRSLGPRVKAERISLDLASGSSIRRIIVPTVAVRRTEASSLVAPKIEGASI